MSRLDRIFYRLEHFAIDKTSTNWMFTSSDHAAVITSFKHVTRQKHRNQHTKLDNSVVTNVESLNELRLYLTEQMTHATNMTPQVKLEFAKMTIRTKALEIMASNRRQTNGRMAQIDADIKNYTELLTRYADLDSQNTIIAELESLNRERNAIMDAQGVKLASRAKTKWYNEGEGSNKYFLNVLKRNTQANEMS